MSPPSTGPPLPFHKTFAASAIAACTAEIMTLPLGECVGPGPLPNPRRRSWGSLPLRRLGLESPSPLRCRHGQGEAPIATQGRRSQVQVRVGVGGGRMGVGASAAAGRERPAVPCRVEKLSHATALPVTHRPPPACPERRGLLGTCMTVAREEGAASLWKGLGPGKGQGGPQDFIRAGCWLLCAGCWLRHTTCTAPAALLL